MQGYENALEVKKAYKVAVTELEGVRKLQSEWDQKGIPEKKYWVIKANVPEQTKQKSLHERMEEKKRGMEQQKKKSEKEIKTGIACKETAGTVNVLIEGSGCNCRLE